MGGLVHDAGWWYDYWYEKLFASHGEVRGSIILMNGYSETVINTNSKIKATKIYVSVAADQIPVCAANVDMVGAIQTSPTQFILYADIKSNSATVFWKIDYADEH